MRDRLGWALSTAGDVAYRWSRGGNIPLAVTGLSRAGKTVFITSMIANLLSAGAGDLTGRRRMQGLGAVATHRLRHARIALAGTQARSLFDFARYSRAMAEAPPRWPTRTDAVAEIGINLRFGPPPGEGGTIRDTRTADLTMRVLDYPGEWLLDPPLLTQDFQAWSCASLDLASEGTRRDLIQPWRAWLDRTDVSGPADDDAAREGAEIWRDYLIECRRHGLRLLQPGRFIRHQLGTDEDSRPELDRPALWFCPLPPPTDNRAREKSLYAEMTRRYEGYRREVHTFFEDIFENFGRQIILVDVLAALNGGREIFEDTCRALKSVHEVVTDQNRSWRRRLTHFRFSTHAERVLFAATKADHVPEAHRSSLALLFRHMLQDAHETAVWAGSAVRVMPIASVICTEEVQVERNGQMEAALVGRPVGREKRSRVFVQPVPGKLPTPAWWAGRVVQDEFPTFEPPLLDPMMGEGVPNYRLDTALEFLLGDRLR